MYFNYIFDFFHILNNISGQSWYQKIKRQIFGDGWSTVTGAISHPDLSRANKSVKVEGLFSFPAFRRQITNYKAVCSAHMVGLY
jgi:hypothetical protein